jgi:hypothetical protein
MSYAPHYPFYYYVCALMNIANLNIVVGHNFRISYFQCYKSWNK